MTYSIVINEKSTIPFNVDKGLRQGDSKSVYLFVVAMEYLSRFFSTLEDNKNIAYHPKLLNWMSHTCVLQMIYLFLREMILILPQL